MAKPFKNILLLCALLLISFRSNSQCTNVCIKGGTVAVTPSGTQSVTPVAGSTFTVAQKSGTTFTINALGTYTVATTYNYVTLAGVNNITSGALSVSVSNVGTAVAQFNGVTLPSGATINIEIPNATLPAYTYDCLTSALVVLVNR